MALNAPIGVRLDNGSRSEMGGTYLCGKWVEPICAIAKIIAPTRLIQAPARMLPEFFELNP